MITILTDCSLKKINTFGFDAHSKYFVEVADARELSLVMNFCKEHACRWQVVGSGSNLLFTKNFDGVTISMVTRGIEILEQDEHCAIVRAEAGVVWDDFVGFCVKNSLYGAENLSGIPGTVGASPVQNVGAYGVEAKDIIQQVEYFSTEDCQFKTIEVEDCQFAYRDSIFKHDLAGRVIVTAVRFKLSKIESYNLSYGNLEERVSESGSMPTLESVRAAVCAIRDEKLPKPGVIGSAGSFFRNPIVSVEVAEDIAKKYPDIKLYPVDAKRVKVPAGWLIDRAGWKGFRRGDAGVYERQALVLVNYGQATGAQILALAEEIRHDVKQKFGVELDFEAIVI
ncbi:MAG: UDP-N-acetylmuramate dehydrogenase [Rikenellaceae bacterium]|nr:UDP-N-acetylmuramate dehydrogenase [Rikenellaceae bacterium]MBO5873552.1 UDP-N-acetylmuramate dehydrogenase [Rikenellaceae bacterium]